MRHRISEFDAVLPPFSFLPGYLSHDTSEHISTASTSTSHFSTSHPCHPEIASLSFCLPVAAVGAQYCFETEGRRGGALPCGQGHCDGADKKERC